MLPEHVTHKCTASHSLGAFIGGDLCPGLMGVWGLGCEATEGRQL